ncbi:MAG: glycosyltransferase [Rhodospirillaceae bacterium]|jgi:glycosyltransferase involved in cell wall biosynthesis|nr:glycosyltransferase [Rhodospirillaceae bacterium]MBT5812534.1 glycosyltransferase [Rhodospirillaceae bacterium]
MIDEAPPLRIVFVLPSLAGGGAERVILALAGALDRARFDPTLIVLTSDGPLAAPANTPVIDLGVRRMRWARWALARRLRTLDPDIVLPTIGHMNIGVLSLRRWLRKRVRIVIRESNVPSASLTTTKRPGLLRFLYRRYYPRADHVIAPSEVVAAELRRDFRVDPARLTVLPQPVDASAFRERAAQEPAGPIRHPGPGPRFVAAGRLTRQKGFDRLLPLLRDAPNDAHLTLLGEGELSGDLRAQAASLGVTGRISFAGFQDNPWAYYAGADAFLLPSRWEGMPNAVLESLAVGTPVIATPESGGIGEIATACAAGALTLASLPDAFADAMKQVRSDPIRQPRPSLLPEIYELAVVVRQFEDLMTTIADQSQ